VIIRSIAVFPKVREFKKIDFFGPARLWPGDSAAVGFFGPGQLKVVVPSQEK
jgi:hypothetical protein